MKNIYLMFFYIKYYFYDFLNYLSYDIILYQLIYGSILFYEMINKLCI